MSSVSPKYGDMFAAAPPGHSLTSDNTQWPWGQPPKFADPNDALDDVIKRLDNEQKQQELFKLLLVGVSIEVIVEGIIFRSFRDGFFTPDVGMLIKAPIGLYIADLAEENSIPYRLFENDNAGRENEMDDQTFLRMMYENNPLMFETMQETINAAIRAGKEPPEERGFLTEREEEPAE